MTVEPSITLTVVGTLRKYGSLVTLSESFDVGGEEERKKIA
jgi:hypothetical protein